MEHIVPARRGRHRGFGLTSNVLSFVSRSLREFDDRLVTLCGCDVRDLRARGGLSAEPAGG
jgi:hypothetical protein